MEFSSLLFIFIFLPLFFLSYFIIKNRTYRNVILLLFSLAFYAYGEPIYILLMLFSILINYFLAIIISKDKHRKFYLILTIIINLGLLGIFKYLNLIINTINIFKIFNIKELNILLPIGISFYTFQILSYVIDVYRKKVKVQKNILNLACYITAFPQLIAGPIVKYETIEEELVNRKENIKDFSDGIRLFIIGLAKKVLIANNVGLIVDTLLKYDGTSVGFIGVLVIIICYTLQIYYDFSGYSNMAIGMGRMMGFHYLENFNYPYIANSITDFWRRWHISLSSFFKEYVYIPLGGNRVIVVRHIINILVVWLLTGLWHGASYNFILWGLYYGIILLIEKYLLKNILNKLPKWMTHIYALIFIMLGWALFRADSLANFQLIFKSLIGINGIGNIKLFIYTETFNVVNIIAIILGIIFSTPILKVINDKLINNKIYLVLRDFILIIIFVISVIYLISGSYNPFIYFRF